MSTDSASGELGLADFRDDLRWRIDTISIDNDEIGVSGWYVPKSGDTGANDVLVNGQAFDLAEL